MACCPGQILWRTEPRLMKAQARTQKEAKSTRQTCILRLGKLRRAWEVEQEVAALALCMKEMCMKPWHSCLEYCICACGFWNKKRNL